MPHHALAVVVIVHQTPALRSQEDVGGAKCYACEICGTGRDRDPKSGFAPTVRDLNLICVSKEYRGVADTKWKQSMEVLEADVLAGRL